MDQTEQEQRVADLRHAIATSAPQPRDAICETVGNVVADAIAEGEFVERLRAAGCALVHVGDGRCPEPPGEWRENALNLMEPGWIDPFACSTSCGGRPGRPGGRSAPPHPAAGPMTERGPMPHRTPQGTQSRVEPSGAVLGERAPGSSGQVIGEPATALASRCGRHEIAASTLYRVPTPIPERREHEDRTVINRGELMRQVGVSQGTAERWYRERHDNGHPEAVVTMGRRLYFDEAQLIGWARAHLDRPAPPARIVRDGRTLITREELRRLTGLAEVTVTTLYSQRASSGHPPAVHRDGLWLYFDEADVLGWHAHRLEAKRATLTPVDRSGDPDELLDQAEAAALLGLSGPKVISSYRARNKGYFPDPDAEQPLRWRRATLWAFADRRSRPGRAGHPRART